MKNTFKKYYLWRILVRDKFYDGNQFNRLLLAYKKIGDIKIDPEPFLGLKWAEIALNARKTHLKNSMFGGY